MKRKNEETLKTEKEPPKKQRSLFQTLIPKNR